ncbi:hypothetical protein KFL_001750240 [Klebsormidium nitens]|uniref:Uncharacterized protein n=1 Tax=Klebsormidium nitens TaxID=105231 RepID=A0A1Y1I5T6_KLENI|nr:hypothetical protein KFL_001750240 [Klebsormidium nitens]|eukprot:GAQ84087.1 hypothetical protein KFL_001750240 [Klebsormidium nitens]
MGDEREKVVGSLGNGLQVEMEKVDFEPRLDTKEDRLNDGHAYSGLLTTDAYKRKREALQKTSHDHHDAVRRKVAEIVAADQAAADREAQARKERDEKRKAKLQAELASKSEKEDDKAHADSAPPSKKRKEKKSAPKVGALSFDDEDDGG